MHLQRIRWLHTELRQMRQKVLHVWTCARMTSLFRNFFDHKANKGNFYKSFLCFGYINKVRWRRSVPSPWIYQWEKIRDSASDHDLNMKGAIIVIQYGLKPWWDGRGHGREWPREGIFFDPLIVEPGSVSVGHSCLFLGCWLRPIGAETWWDGRGHGSEWPREGIFWSKCQ